MILLELIASGLNFFEGFIVGYFSKTANFFPTFGVFVAWESCVTDISWTIVFIHVPFARHWIHKLFIIQE